MPHPRRKKWTEAEERTLIDKYREMICDGSLSKMKTREKKFKPIALHVNSIHHHVDPIAYPWEWSWKDVSNKVQNMRHQYSLVKQKIKSPESGDPAAGDAFDWVEGLTHWSNFLRYKEVFGDVTVTLPFDDSPAGVNTTFDEGNLVEFAGLEFDYNDDHLKENGDNNDNNDNNGFVYGEIETMGSETKIKKKALKNFEKKAWGFVANQLSQIREMEARFEQREEERVRERQVKERLRVETDKKREERYENMRKKIEILREAMDNDWEDRKRRRNDELVEEKKREERMSIRRSEWAARIDEILGQHRAEMAQIQARILHEQQGLTGQLLGLFSQWTGHATGISDNTNTTNNNNNGSGHYFSQMMQNLQHVDGDTRVEGHNEGDEFIVDG